MVTGDGEKDDGHRLVLAAMFPVITAVPETADCLLLPDWTSKDYMKLLTLLYGGENR